jgi:hypothetical protein
VVFNVTGTVASPTLPGVSLQLHPALVNSADPVLRTATADSVTGTLTVPARSVAVFVAAAG